MLPPPLRMSAVSCCSLKPSAYASAPSSPLRMAAAAAARSCSRPEAPMAISQASGSRRSASAVPCAQRPAPLPWSARSLGKSPVRIASTVETRLRGSGAGPGAAAEQAARKSTRAINGDPRALVKFSDMLAGFDGGALEATLEAISAPGGDNVALGGLVELAFDGFQQLRGAFLLGGHRGAVLLDRRAQVGTNGAVVFARAFVLANALACLV